MTAFPCRRACAGELLLAHRLQVQRLPGTDYLLTPLSGNYRKLHLHTSPMNNFIRFIQSQVPDIYEQCSSVLP